MRAQDLERFKEKAEQKETEIKSVNQITKKMENEFRSEKEKLNEALHSKTKQLIDHLNRDRGPSRSRRKDDSVKGYYEEKDSDESEKEGSGAMAIKRFAKRVSQSETIIRK